MQSDAIEEDSHSENLVFQHVYMYKLKELGVHKLSRIAKNG